jgi:hypothetical protein
VENLEKIDQWILENSETLDLNVKLFENTTLESFGIFDLETSIRIGERTYFGRGTAFERELALKKACSEAIERFFLSKNRYTTSNGIAVHQSYELAAKAAQSELIERDLFMCHFLTSTPFSPVEIQNDFLLRVKRSLSLHGAHITFYSMGSLNGIEGILCAIDGLSASEPFGYILGSSAGNSTNLWQSAFLEAFRNFAHLDKNRSLSLESFLEKEKGEGVGFIDHGLLALDIGYASKLKEIYFNESFVAQRSEKSEQKVFIRLEEIEKKETIFEGSPLIVTRATSSELQNLFVGTTDISNVNRSRLEKFSELRNKKLSLSMLPHPFN